MKTSIKLLSLLLLVSSAAALRAHDQEVIITEQTRGGSEFERTFEVNLSFEQELVGPAAGPWVPRPASDKPHNVHGKLQLCFAKDLSSVKYKLFVFDADGTVNPNELIRLAHLHAGNAAENGPIIVALFEHPAPCGIAVDGLLAQGTITNDKIAHVSPVSKPGFVFNSVASILEGIREGIVYSNVHGGDTCSTNPNDPKYGGGIIRGQIFSN